MVAQGLIWRFPRHFRVRLLFLCVSVLTASMGIDAIEYVSISGRMVLRDQQGRTVDNEAGLQVIVFYYAGDSRLAGSRDFAVGQDGTFAIQVPLEAKDPLKREITKVESCRFVSRQKTGYWLDREVVLPEQGKDLRVLLEAAAKLDLVGSFSIAGVDEQELDTVRIRIRDLGTGRSSHVNAKPSRQGEFRLVGVLVPGRPYRVTASLLAFRKSTVVFEGSARIGPVECGEIVLEPAGTIAGKLLLGDEPPRREVKHALVLEGIDHLYRVHHPVVPGGAFEFPYLPVGRYRLTLAIPSDDGAWEGELLLEVTPRQLEHRGIELVAREIHWPAKVPARKEEEEKVTLSGAVIGPGEEPVVGASVEAFSGTDLRRAGLALTEARGRFSLEVPLGHYRVRAAHSKRGEEKGMSWVEVTLRQDTDVVIKLPNVHVFPCTVEIPEKFRPIEAVSLTHSMDRENISLRSIFQSALFVSQIHGKQCRVAARELGQNQVVVLAALGEDIGAFLVDANLPAEKESIVLAAKTRDFVLLE